MVPGGGFGHTVGGIGTIGCAGTGGGHTPGVAWVEVRSDPPVVLTSDVAYLQENLTRHVAPGGSMDGASDLRAYDAMKAMRGARFVPGHDPATMDGQKRMEIAK